MLPAKRLPPELWLIILDLARRTSTGPRQYCNYLTFPHLILHLGSPSEHTFTIHTWPRTFRLICRYFNSLLEQPPPFFMKNANVAIPAATRALYILPQPDPRACLQRLLADSSIGNRITLLNLPGYEGSDHEPPANFNFLCDNAHFLPAVRILTLCLRDPTNFSRFKIPRFWWRLNNAFPLLTTLILRGELESTYPDPEVVFKHLEVMDWDNVDHQPTLQFPALRHASFTSTGFCGPIRIVDPPRLESLLIRNVRKGARFQWSNFPNLRFLGLPAKRIDAFCPLPPGHPLQHLYVIVGDRPRDDRNQHLFSYEALLKKTIERMPTITRLSIWFSQPRYINLKRISGNPRKEDFKRLGFIRRDVPYTDYENGYHIFLQRVQAEPPPEAAAITSGEPVPHHSGFGVG